MTDANLWAGFFVAVAAATAMVSYMVWHQASGLEIEAARVRRAIMQVWAAVVLGLAAGVGVRVLLGGAVIAVGRNPDAPLGLWVRTLQRHETAVVAVGMGIIAACFVWAMRAVRAVTIQPRKKKDDRPS